jgi:hypothetical protein
MITVSNLASDIRRADDVCFNENAHLLTGHILDN